MDYNRPPKLESKRYNDLGSMFFFKNLPYFIAALILAMIYVWNVNSLERKIRQNQLLIEENKKLKWDYWSIKSKILFGSIESEISKKVIDKDILINDNVPKVLVRVEN
ncbi:MAG: hypothetical protein IT267_00910 [Saprospiraceae bacterium]|nr:hypothetical protein [Saprospiraceae bacterium]